MIGADERRRVLSLLPCVAAFLALTCAPTHAQGPVSQSTKPDPLRSLEAYQIVELAVPQDLVSGFTVDVPLAGRSRTLVLAPYSIRAEGFEVLAHVEGGALVPVPYEPARTVRGTIDGIKGSVVAGSLMDHGLELVVYLPNGRVFGLEPLRRFRPEAGRGEYLIYRGQDTRAEMVCSTTDPRQSHEDDPPGGSAALSGQFCGTLGPVCIAELACEGEYSFYVARGSSTSAVRDIIELWVNTLNVMYERDARITHRITTLIVRTVDIGVRSLPEFRDYWNANHTGINRDMAHLFSASFPGAGGQAYVGAVCDPSNAYGTSDFWEEAQFLTCETHLVGHELGHNWSLGHCDGLPGCCDGYLMCSWFPPCGLRFYPSDMPIIANYRELLRCLDSGVWNDECINATVVCPGTYTGTLNGATADGGSICGSATDRSVWFAYTPATNGTLVVGSDLFSPGGVLSVHEAGCPGDESNEISCDAANPAEVTVAVLAGRTYRIRVAQSASYIAPIFTLTVSGPACEVPPNDACTSAYVVAPGRYQGDTSTATNDGSSSCGSSSSSADVWYQYTPEVDGDLVVDTIGSRFDTVLSVHSGCPGDASNEVACNDDEPISSTLQSLVTLRVTQGTNYYIRIAGYDGGVGSYRVGITGPMNAYDLCSKARAIGTGTFIGDLEGTTNDGSTRAGLSYQPDVWFRFTAPTRGVLTADTCGSNDLRGVNTGIDTVLSIHSGCPGTSDNSLVWDDDSACTGDVGMIRDSQCSVALASGQTVYIRVSRFSSTSLATQFKLNVDFQITNDSPITPGVPSGPSFGYETMELIVTSVTTDPDGDSIRYTFDWGDGTTTASGLFASGVPVSLSHSYSMEGAYGIRVRATDIFGAESAYSAALNVDVADVDNRVGNVSRDNGGSAIGVLKVNGSRGTSASKTMVADNDSPLEVSLDAIPDGPAAAKYAIWVWRRRPTSSSDKLVRYQGAELGTMAMDPLLGTCGSSCPQFAAKAIDRFCSAVLCSTAEATGASPPGVILRIPAGRLAAGEVLWVQGLVKDNSDTSGKRFSVTNGVEVTVME